MHTTAGQMIRTWRVAKAKRKQRTTSGGRELDPPPPFTCLLVMTRTGAADLDGSLVDGDGGDWKGRGSDDESWGMA